MRIKTDSKFTNLGVIDSVDLAVFGGTQAQARDQIHHKENDAGSAKRVGEAGHGIRELVGKLDVVTIQPASVDHREAIQMRDVVTKHDNRQNQDHSKMKQCLRCEQAGQKISDYTANRVLREDIEGVVHFQHIFQLRGEVATYGAHDAKDDG